MNSEEEEFKAARRKVRKLRHFYSHLSTYAVVITFLHIINLLTSSYYWAIWPALGWGFGLAMHAIGTFQWAPFLGPEWEERQVQKLLDQKRRQKENEGPATD
ncbi:2TM domain-containing protein [Sneathiella glossodoripedis]|uniref:2TM domain-containing protein n=1 Tax=Sneathiella glossodoripedis TaxID=418853 RepID=UPI00047128EB|nr:2TM domain-containing protein [Sneathiella glossodoripedis]